MDLTQPSSLISVFGLDWAKKKICSTQLNYVNKWIGLEKHPKDIQPDIQTPLSMSTFFWLKKKLNAPLVFFWVCWRGGSFGVRTPLELEHGSLDPRCSSCFFIFLVRQGAVLVRLQRNHLCQASHAKMHLSGGPKYHGSNC